MIGKSVSHYKIIEKLGAGGMGDVYKAEDTKLKRTVALKFLPREYSSDLMAKERFVHEAQAASALDHPNICTIHEIGETEDGQSYIAMACYEGNSLQSSIANNLLSTDQCIRIIIQIAMGLQKAHDAGIVHRDIKPANIMITNDETVKILDFGLAKLAGQTRLTKTGATVGTVAYMSPEQAKGNTIDQRTDIWSLGVVMYEMLSGKLPFGGEYEQALVYSIINEEPLQLSVLNEDVSEELEAIVHKCLAKDSNARYQTIDDLLADFKKFSQEAEISFDESLPKLIKRMWRKKIIRIITTAFTAALLLTIGWLLLWPNLTELPPIAVIPFKNRTGDTSNDIHCKSIADALIIGLEESGLFTVTTFERMNDLLKQAGKKGVEFPNSELGFELCRMDGVSSLVVGSLVKMGDIFSIDLKVLDVETKDLIIPAKSKGRGIESILETQIDELTEEVVTGLGGIDEEQFVKSHRLIVDVTTNNTEAYNHYIVGRDKFNAYYWREAKEEFTKAVLLDSTFALAHLYLARTYAAENSTKEMYVHLELAKKYRNKITQKEQVRLDFAYDRAKGNDVSKSLSALKGATALYPKEKQFFMLLGNYYRDRDIDTSIDYYQKVLELDPNHRDALNQIGYRYAVKKEYTKALEYLKRYADVAPNEANPYDTMADVYLLMKEYKKSIEMNEKVLKVKPSLGPRFGIARNFIQMREYQEARNYLNKWCKNASSFNARDVLHLFLATTYMAEGDLQNTLKELENRCNNAEQKSEMGFVNWFQLQISEILYEHSKIKEAEERLSAVKKYLESSDLSESHKNRFWREYHSHSTRLSLKEGDIDQAKEYAEIYKNESENLDWYYSLTGLVAYAEDNYEKAISELNKSDLNDPINNYHLALAYIKNSEDTKALDYLESAVNYNGFPSPRNELIRSRAEKQLAIVMRSAR